MSLLNKIFHPDEAKKSEEALKEARAFFQTLTAYAPVLNNAVSLSIRLFFETYHAAKVPACNVVHNHE